MQLRSRPSHRAIWPVRGARSSCKALQPSLSNSILYLAIEALLDRTILGVEKSMIRPQASWMRVRLNLAPCLCSYVLMGNSEAHLPYHKLLLVATLSDHYMRPTQVQFSLHTSAEAIMVVATFNLL